MPPSLASVFPAKGVATKMLNNADNTARQPSNSSAFGPQPKLALSVTNPESASFSTDSDQIGNVELVALGSNDSEWSDCFVAGKENKLVARLIREVIGGNGIEKLRQISPFVLVGPNGCGKSLLAKAIFDSCSEAFEEDDRLLITANDFRRRLDQSIREEQIELFRDRFRELKLLIVEDLHRLPANDLLQEEIMRTFACIQQNGGTVVTTFAKPPGHIATLSRRLLSWLASGLSLEISQPALEARIEILRQNLLKTGAPPSKESLKALSHTLSGDIRQILKIGQELRKRFGKRNRLTLGQAQAYMADIPRADTPPLRQIANIVAKYYSLTLRDLRSSSRKQTVVLARAITIFLARELTPLSYEDIGRYFGGRDHTTVMHNFNRIEDRLPTERALRSAIDDIRIKIKDSSST